MAKVATFYGEFYCKSEGGKMAVQEYEVKLEVPSTVKTKEQARSIAKNLLVKEYLSGKESGFQGIRTCQIDSLDEIDDKKTESDEIVALMLEAQELQCVPENISSYKRRDYKIAALRRSIEKRKVLLEKEALKKEREEAMMKLV